jgi:hypothetical protein
MAEAINYALAQWTELNVFCFDGAVRIDNNVSEREMKRVVLNRKINQRTCRLRICATRFAVSDSRPNRFSFRPSKQGVHKPWTK